MPSITPDDVANYLARNFSGTQYDRCEAILGIVTAECRVWTRGVGFDDAGKPNAELWGVIVGATARRMSNTLNVIREEMGGLSVVHAPAGFSLTEIRVLNAFREMAL